MKIEEIKQCRVAPFETADRKLLNLFSFFLHLAPTIESEKALNIEKSRLENNWNRFIESIPINQYIFIDDHRSLETVSYTHLKKFGRKRGSIHGTKIFSFQNNMTASRTLGDFFPALLAEVCMCRNFMITVGAVHSFSPLSCASDC